MDANGMPTLRVSWGAWSDVKELHCGRALMSAMIIVFIGIVLAREIITIMIAKQLKIYDTTNMFYR